MSKITDRLERQADILAQSIDGWELNTLTRIGERIKRIGSMSVADVKALNNIADVKGDMKLIMRELAHITGTNISETQRIYSEALEEQHLQNNSLYDYRGKIFVPFAENTRLKSIVKAYAKTTGADMINLSASSVIGFCNKRTGFEGLEKAYIKALDKAVMAVTSGATDFHSAMRDTIRELGGSGIRVHYGGDVTRSLESAVRQSLLWGAKQASIEYDDALGEELGCDGIEIDWHSNPRPEHEFMQGKQYVLGKARTINGVLFESADEALERLNDYGCLHYKTSIICGVSEPRYSPEELKRLNAQNAKTYDIDGKKVTGYQAQQMMRRLEAATRTQKTEKALAKASGDNAEVKKCNEKIKAFRAKYDELTRVTGFTPDYKRMGITRTPKTTENPLTNSGNGGIIKASRNISSRSMANGGRKSPFYILNDIEIESLKNDIKAIEADESVFAFNAGAATSYSDERDIIFVKGDILPDTNSLHPRDLMSSRAVLAHEYYGHRAHRGTKIADGAWNDEFRASYSAAKNAPNLSDEDRRYLILDALERAKEHGISIEYNDYIRRVING